MLQFPRWRVDVTVGGDLVKTFYETATTSAAAIGKAKHKMRGAVSSAGAFKFKATKVEAGEPARHHATKKKSPAQLQREIDEVLAKPSGSARDQQLAEAIDSGSRERAAELYGVWTSQYSNEDRDRVSGLAGRLTDIDRQEGRASPPVGSSRLRLDQAEQVVRDANSYGAFQQGLSAQRRARR